MEKAKGNFFHFLQIQTEKLTLLLKKVFSDEYFNEKWEEVREAASCQWERAAGGRRFSCWLTAGNTPRWAVPRPVLPAEQPVWSLWKGADGTTLTVQHEETKQDKISK